MNRLKFLLAVFVVIVLALGIYSCAKESSQNLNSNQDLTITDDDLISNEVPKSLESNNNFTPSFLKENLGPLKLGKAHNILLAKYLTLYPQGITSSNYQSQYIFVDQFFNSEFSEYFDCNGHTLTSFELARHELYLNRTVTGSKQTFLLEFEFSVQRLNQLNILSSKSNDLVRRYKKAIFGDNLSYEELQNKLDDLIQLSSLDLSHYEKELLQGLFSISKSSHEYWAQNAGSRWPRLYADCVGYVAGWLSAIDSEIQSTGGLSEANSDYRMRQGFLWGAAGSAVTP